MKRMSERTDELKRIKDEVVGLIASPLYEERIKTMAFPVIGEGSHEARVMFIGEAPGKNEAHTGRPFCGAAGRVLDELLAHIGLPREQVYITNIVKDRPPNNRDPLPDEIAIYAPFLDRQINIIQPKVLVTLGRFSTPYLMERLGLGSRITKISLMRAQVYSAQMPYGDVSLVPMFHPAVGVYNRSSIPQLKADMEVIKSLL